VIIESAGRKEQKKLLRIICLAGAVIFLVLLTYILNFSAYKISGDVTHWAAFGDFVGGTLNPLLTFLGLIAILITFKGQILELNQSHKELAQANKHKKEELDVNLKQFKKTDIIEFIKLVDTDVRGSLEEEVYLPTSNDIKINTAILKCYREYKQSEDKDFFDDLKIHISKMELIYQKIIVIFDNAEQVDKLIGNQFYLSYYKTQYKELFEKLAVIIEGIKNDD
jgi:hypothetical protein